MKTFSPDDKLGVFVENFHNSAVKLCREFDKRLFLFGVRFLEEFSCLRTACTVMVTTIIPLINKHAVAWWDPCLEKRLLCVIILNHDTLGALIFSGYVLLEDIRTIY